jgi:uncharacterized protein (DUF2252 family)
MKNESKALPRPSQRQGPLIARRNLKMARSAHAYVRGNTQQFYEWLAARKRHTLPEGPAVWICGDCHLGNLGPVAAADGTIDIQIRDLDQTVIGNPAHDLIRLGLSLAMAARSSDLPGVTTARMLERMIEGYQQAFAKGDGQPHLSLQRPESVRTVMKEALRRSWKHLARERIGDARPTIPLGRNFWPLASKERRAVEALFATEEIRRLATSLRYRDDDADVELVDAAYWVKGCSSLGRLRIAALMSVGRGGSDEDLCLMDIKEATLAVAPRYRGATLPRDNGERVVEGARHVAPALGERMRAARLLDRTVFVRELLPQDLKLEIDELTPDEAMCAARYLSAVVGRAHAAQMDMPTRRAWRKEVGRTRSKTLDAPSWLWRSVVELAGQHEAAYLDHCRRYALDDAKA